MCNSDNVRLTWLTLHCGPDRIKEAQATSDLHNGTLARCMLDNQNPVASAKVARLIQRRCLYYLIGHLKDGPNTEGSGRQTMCITYAHGPSSGHPRNNRIALDMGIGH